MARSTMAALIARVRQLIFDVSGSPTWTDDDIQNVMDESRLDIVNQTLTPKPTYSGSSIQFLNYYSDLKNWEDDATFKQYLTVAVAPLISEPIAGHWVFAASTLPPIFISGKSYDIYRAAADLLERLAARSVLQFAFSSDGQSFQPQQVVDNVAKLVKMYRTKQRMGSSIMSRSDLNAGSRPTDLLGPREIDYMVSGDN